MTEKIIQISTVVNGNNHIIYGLGHLGGLYFWSQGETVNGTGGVTYKSGWKLMLGQE